jgi:signal transduction histidine kinase
MALGCAEIRAILTWALSRGLGGSYSRSAPTVLWMGFLGQAAVMLSSVLFLASLSSVSFKFRGRRVLYAIPYAVPLMIYLALYYGPFAGASAQTPAGALLWIYGLLGLAAMVIAFFWSAQKGAIPIWLATAIVIFGSLIALPFFLKGLVYWPIQMVESGNLIMTALLVVYTYRRRSPGVVLAAFGFASWALPPFVLMQTVVPGATVGLFGVYMSRAEILGKVFVALGLILLVLEDEVQKNQLAQQRERRVRLELEAYARQALTARSLEEFDRGSSELCRLIVEHSQFSGSALVVRGVSGSFMLVGFAGMDGATAGALDALAQRLPPSCFAESGHSLVEDSLSMDLDLSPWLTPGDDLERLRLTRVGAVPMLSHDNSADGALLLIGSRAPLETLRADDLLPLEILAGRVQAARAQALMLGKLIESERFAGVGQLANNVAQQLNNPLTVILGYSALMEEAAAGTDRKGAEAIVVEARKMRAILERLSRFSKISAERFNSFSVMDLLADIEQLHRTDFLRHSIEFRLTSPGNLPNIFGNAHQIRQALLHAMQFAIDSVIRISPNEEKSVQIEASTEDGRVQILVRHSGPGFPFPERAFDSLSSGFTGTETTGIGLSLCAAIVREHRGNITAINYDPTGSAVLIELPVS